MPKSSALSTQLFSIEHIKPKSLAGKTTLDNLALACQGCNKYKYNKIKAFDFVSGEFSPLYNPGQQHWNDHFGWNYDFTLTTGLKPTDAPQ